MELKKTNLLELLKNKKNLDVISLDKVNPNITFKNIKYIKSDFAKYSFASSTAKSIDFVIHLAAETSVVESEKNPMNFYNENINKTINFFFKCKDIGIKHFIFFSTAGAIAGNASNVSESSKENPLSFYGISKQMTEKLLIYFGKKYNINITIIRLSNVYGKYSLHKSSFIHLFLKKLKKSEALDIYGNGNQTRDFIYAEDISNIINKIINKNIIGIFVLASGKSYSINDIISLIKKLKKYDIKINYLKPRTAEVKDSSFNNKKIIKTLGIKFTKIDKGLIKTINWYRKNYF